MPEWTLDVVDVVLSAIMMLCLASVRKDIDASDDKLEEAIRGMDATNRRIEAFNRAMAEMGAQLQNEVARLNAAVAQATPATGDDPDRYAGDGEVTCDRAAESMHAGWARAGRSPHYTTSYWVTNALKYLWRFPLKGGVEDLRKAEDCISRAIDGYEEAESDAR